jgi:hypothetical protein
MVSQKLKAGNEKYAKIGEKDDFLFLSVTRRKTYLSKEGKRLDFFAIF